MSMPFDAHTIEAKLALDKIDPRDWPKLACDALEAGFDGSTIRRLAALTRPSGWETDQLLPAFMAEACLKKISLEEAAIRFAVSLARQILSEKLDPLCYRKDFYALWIRADYPGALQELATLDDYQGRPEAEVREDAWKAINELIEESVPNT